MHKFESKNAGLVIIGAFKLIKGLALILVGIAILKLVHHDVVSVVTEWVARVHVDPENKYIHKVMAKLLLVDDRKLREIGAGTFFYAALFLTEGVGLILRKTWAEYFTIIVTSSFLPIEVYALAEHLTFPRLLALAVNMGILWYLVAHRMKERRKAAA
jgi:uncharacterized membrane protein (DUF2068 family)